jgi:tRNA 2-thiouridine synthesizing protein A
MTERRCNIVSPFLAGIEAKFAPTERLTSVRWHGYRSCVKRLSRTRNSRQRRQTRHALRAVIFGYRRYGKSDWRFRRLSSMSEKTLNLRGLKCPLPALRTKKALGSLVSGDILIVECTDPLAGVDIPNLLNQTGDLLENTIKDKRLLTFRIRKK